MGTRSLTRIKVRRELLTPPPELARLNPGAAINDLKTDMNAKFAEVSGTLSTLKWFMGALVLAIAVGLFKIFFFSAPSEQPRQVNSHSNNVQQAQTSTPSTR